jgi:hypothetical protein
MHSAAMRFAGNRMLKKSASGVLASLRDSTLKRTFRKSETLAGLIRSPRSIRGVNGHTKCGLYLLASSLAAALLDGHFEHPENFQASATKGKFQRCFVYQSSFSAAW